MADDGKSHPPRGWGLALAASAVCAAIVAVSFMGGLYASRYRFARLVAEERRTETLLGGLKHVRTPADEVAGILAIYGLKPGEEERLAAIPWAPRPVPAPFVGAMAAPGRAGGVTINAHGFRDRREDYAPKTPGTYRVFLTGGSTAFGSGAETEERTPAALLERRLDIELGGQGRRFEAITAALPGWSTTHERILIENRIARLRPDRIVMLSGFNDILWATFRADIDRSFNFPDQHFVALLNQAHRLLGGEPLTPPQIVESAPAPCAEVARRAGANVTLAAHAARLAGAELVFALQPSIVSGGKILTERETRVLNRIPGGPQRWRECYETLRVALGAIDVPGYRFLDLTGAFAGVPASREFFIDTSHFPGAGNALVADRLYRALPWPGKP